MSDELVLDASVAAKCFITEDGSDAARKLVKSDRLFVAPDLLLIEIASIAAKRVRRGDISEMLATEAIRGVRGLVGVLVPTADLTLRAFEFALLGFSAYDGIYLALAERRGCKVVTMDLKLLWRASSLGHADLVEQL